MKFTERLWVSEFHKVTSTVKVVFVKAIQCQWKQLHTFIKYW